MTTPEASEAIDTRTVLRGYAVVAAVAGFAFAAWGPMWLGTSLGDQPWANAVLIRIWGAVVMAAGCCAAGFAQIGDTGTRRRAFLWFVLAHAVLLLVMASQMVSVGRGIPGSGDFGFYGLIAALILLAYFWRTADAPRPGRTPAAAGLVAERLRAQYEEQIREAASQEERNRLARELHDSIKQQIFVMQTSAATAQTRFDRDPDGAKAALEQLRDAARDAMLEMEAMLDNLRAAPLENIGLVETLRKQCEALRLRTGAQVRFEHGEMPPRASLAPGAQQAIFRVAQEALANIGRHARAASVRVSLGCRNRHLALQIEDDGAGFDPGAVVQGMGLRNMQARAAAFSGRLALTSRPGGGTCVELSIPYTLPDIAAYRRRLLASASVMALFVVRVVGEVALFGRFTGTPVDLLFLFVTGVILLSVVASYRRAREQSKRLSCLESPSHS